MRALTYDAAGRLATESLSAGTTATYGSTETTIVDGRSEFGFTRSSGGRVASVEVGSIEFSVSYDGGMVSGFRHRADSVEFRRDDRGRIIGTTFPDGSTRTYAYDALGNRTIARHSLDEAEHYTYDGLGNLVEVSIDSRGVRSTQTYRIGDMHGVERITGPNPESVDIGYDSVGRPTVFTTSDAVVRVEYDGMGGISAIRSETHDTPWVPDGTAAATADAHDSEKDPTCAPCNPPVGTAMYKEHREHPTGGNHGVAEDSHVHHWEVHQSPPDSPVPCNCFSQASHASDSIYAGEIGYVRPTGGGIEGC